MPRANLEMYLEAVAGLMIPTLAPRSIIGIATENASFAFFKSFARSAALTSLIADLICEALL